VVVVVVVWSAKVYGVKASEVRKKEVEEGNVELGLGFYVQRTIYLKKSVKFVIEDLTSMQLRAEVEHHRPCQNDKRT